MSFAERVATLRKQKCWTQQHLAELVGVPVLQIRRYEIGVSQSTLDAIRRLALALGGTTDELIFDKSERGSNEDLQIYDCRTIVAWKYPRNLGHSGDSALVLASVLGRQFFSLRA